MPNRIVREGINSSPRVNALSPLAQLFYRRLLSVVDDYGRFHAAPTTLHGACWPTCPDHVTDSQIVKWLDECCSGPRPLLTIYQVDSAKYLQLSDFRQPIRTKSKFPDIESNPKADCEQTESTLHAPFRSSYSVVRSAKCDKIVPTGTNGFPPEAVFVKDFLAKQHLVQFTETEAEALQDPDWWDRLSIACHGLDAETLEIEFAKMGNWLSTGRGKGRRPTKRFIQNWLIKAGTPL